MEVTIKFSTDSLSMVNHLEGLLRGSQDFYGVEVDVSAFGWEWMFSTKEAPNGAFLFTFMGADHQDNRVFNRYEKIDAIKFIRDSVMSETGDFPTLLECKRYVDRVMN